MYGWVPLLSTWNYHNTVNGYESEKLIAQLCLTLCNPVDCSPPGSSVHGILQARILKWVTIPFSRGSSRSRHWTLVSCIAGGFFTLSHLGTSILKHYPWLINSLLSHNNPLGWRSELGKSKDTLPDYENLYQFHVSMYNFILINWSVHFHTVFL